MGRRRGNKGRVACTDAGKAGAGAPRTFLDDTAYRRAEKHYRRYTHAGALPTDYSDVLDCRDTASNTEPNRARLHRVSAAAALPGWPDVSEPVLYEVDGCPGLFVAPGALTVDEQRLLAFDCATSYHQRPNATNLLAAAKPTTAEGPRPEEPELEPEPDPAPEPATLERLRALRWATLGYQYQWTSRTYLPGAATAMPHRLSALCTGLAGAAGYVMEPQAAIVNYYNPKVCGLPVCCLPAA